MAAPYYRFNRYWVIALLSTIFMPSNGPLNAQDVVIEDPLPILQPHRDRMANRPLMRLGSVNPYLHKPDRVTSPYNTAMMVFDPLQPQPEGEEVTLEMLQPELEIQKKPFFSRLWDSVTNLFRRP